MTTIDITHPEIAKQWHPTKNGSLKTSDFTSGSGKKVFWLCPSKCYMGCLHEWETSISNRSKRGDGCPYCAKPRKKLCVHDSIVSTHPQIVLEWHPTKNINIDPSEYSTGSNKNVWWLCNKTCPMGCLHEWQTNIGNRCKSKDPTLCPWCCTQKWCIHLSIVTSHPKIAGEWHPSKNKGETPDKYLSKSNKKVWWRCNTKCPEGCFHDWEETIGNRINKRTNCPYCSARKTHCCEHTSIKYTFPDISTEWHPTKNINIDINMTVSGSHNKVWWLCSKIYECGCPHEWEAQIKSRTFAASGCPHCSGLLHCQHRSIVYTHPEIASEWHPTKNNKIDIKNITKASNTPVWWSCSKSRSSHEWKTNTNNRIGLNRGCPYCLNKTESKLYDYLRNLYPDTITQFKLDSCKFKKHLPFDFCIPELKTIIELDGRQHFEQVSNWGCPEKAVKRDIFKMQKAEKAGYKIIRIFQEDVYNNDLVWLSEHLLRKIVCESREPSFISPTIVSIYDKHIKMYNIGVNVVLESSDVDI